MATEDDSDVPDTGAVFTFGKSKFGDSGPGKFWIKNDKVVDISCGDEHTALVAESGRLFTFGSNDWGQLGLGHNKVTLKPSRVKALKAEKVTLVSCGKTHTIAATESGKLYTFGNNGDGQLGVGSNMNQNNSTPQCLAGLEGEMKMLAAGTDHSVVLTVEGDVYVWGGGGEGQLGLGQETDEVQKPIKVELGGKAVCIACGYYHTAIVTEEGKLLTFGEKEDGKLGQGDETADQYTPQEVAGISGKVTWVSCGGSHTVAVTENGKAYAFGQGSNGQLGLGTNRLKSDVPELVPIKEKIKFASCGESHTALISNRGKLYTFGDGRHGKLGLGEENFANQFVPCVAERFSKFTCEKVSCGGCHMLVTAKPKMENGTESEEEDKAEESEETKMAAGAVNPQISALSDSMDLSGSFSARNRRRDRLSDDVFPHTALPPLNAKLPPLTNGHDTLSKGTLPEIKSYKLADMRAHSTIREESFDEGSKPYTRPKTDCENKPDGDNKILSEDGDNKILSEDGDNKDVKKSISEETKTPYEAFLAQMTTEDSAAPETEKDKESKSDEATESDLDPESSEEDGMTKSRKKSHPEAPPKAAPRKQSEEEEEESSEEESGEDKEGKTTKPVPAKRGKQSPAESGEESAKEQAKPHKKPKQKSKKAKEESEEEEEESSEEESEEEEEEPQPKKETKKKNDKKKSKKGIFGKKKAVKEEESEESEEEEEESEEEEEEPKSKSKSKSKKSKDKKKEKKKESEEEDEEGEEEGESEEEEEEEEEKKEADKPKPVEKKSKTCTIL